MNTDWKWVAIFAAIVLGCVVADTVVRAAEQSPAFSQPDAIAQWMRNDPAAMMRWCVEHLTQAQLDEIAALAIPPLTDDERLQALKDAKALLERAGATDPAKAADVEIKAIQYKRAKAAESETVITDRPRGGGTP